MIERTYRFTLGTLAALTAVLVLSGNAFAAETAEMRKRGHDLLEKSCGSCHAVEKSGASKHHLAPPFRTLGERYSIESLEEALGEGIVSGHPDMPEFEFDADEVGAIVAYLKTLQPAKPKATPARKR